MHRYKLPFSKSSALYDFVESNCGLAVGQCDSSRKHPQCAKTGWSKYRVYLEPLGHQQFHRGALCWDCLAFAAIDLPLAAVCAQCMVSILCESSGWINELCKCRCPLCRRCQVHGAVMCAS